MIIWGSKVKEKELSAGQFFCPNCRGLRAYKQKRFSKHFTLYFIPLFETQNLGERVECQVCNSVFDSKVLVPDTQRLLELVATTRQSLLHGASLADVRGKLIAAGADEQGADTIIGMAQNT